MISGKYRVDSAMDVIAHTRVLSCDITLRCTRQPSAKATQKLENVNTECIAARRIFSQRCVSMEEVTGLDWAKNPGILPISFLRQFRFLRHIV